MVQHFLTWLLIGISDSTSIPITRTGQIHLTFLFSCGLTTKVHAPWCCSRYVPTYTPRTPNYLGHDTLFISTRLVHCLQETWRMWGNFRWTPLSHISFFLFFFGRGERNRSFEIHDFDYHPLYWINWDVFIILRVLVKFISSNRVREEMWESFYGVSMAVNEWVGWNVKWNLGLKVVNMF